ncbi:MAG: RebB family R body protein [Alphaproteobacteria bacterium]
MALSTLVNGQITDSVAQAGVTVLANAPAMAMGSIYQSLAHSTGILYQNSVQAQKMAAISAQAATNQGVIQIYSVNTMAAAATTNKLARSDTPNWMLTLLVVLAALKGK